VPLGAAAGAGAFRARAATAAGIGHRPGSMAGATRRITIAPRLPWPTGIERVIYAGLGWLPLAFLVAFGGGAVSGCGTATVSCPAFVPPLQALILAGTLVGLLAFPRIAYLASGAGVGMIVAGLGVLAVSAVLSLASPAARQFEEPTIHSVSAGVAALVVAVLLAAYALAGLAVWRDRPIARPWLGRPRRGAPPPAGSTSR
jgi:hypothetical protein